MTTEFKTSDNYSPCQTKFGFDVSTNSPLQWCEYFGWEDNFDMISAFMSKNLKSDDVSFVELDGSCAKLTIIFEMYAEPKDFVKVYNQVLELLAKFDAEPNYNPDVEQFNIMLENLENEGTPAYEGDSDEVVFAKHNKYAYGFSTYQEHLASIAKEKMLTSLSDLSADIAPVAANRIKNNPDDTLNFQ